MPHSSTNVTSASGESPCSSPQVAVLSVASTASISSRWRTCPGMLSVLLPANVKSRRSSPPVDVVFVAVTASISSWWRTCLGMLSVLVPATRMSPTVVDLRAELAGRTECRRTPNLSFHPPTLPLARWIKKEDALEALAKEGTRLRLSDLPRASPESREALKLQSGRPKVGFWPSQVWALAAPSLGSGFPKVGIWPSRVRVLAAPSLGSCRPKFGFWLPQVWALDAPSVGSPILRDEDHSQYFLPLPLPLPLNGLPSPLPPFGGPQVFEDEESGFAKQLSLLWPGFWQKLQLCSIWQSLLPHPFGVFY